MNQRDAERRLEALEARRQARDLQPMLERLSTETGFSVTELQDEAERLRVAYGTDPAAMAHGIAWEQGITVEQVREEAMRVTDVV